MRSHPENISNERCNGIINGLFCCGHRSVLLWPSVCFATVSKYLKPYEFSSQFIQHSTAQVQAGSRPLRWGGGTVPRRERNTNSREGPLGGENVRPP